MAQTGGAETITLTVSQIPAHTHAVLASKDPFTGSIPNGAVLAQGPNMYLTNTAPNAVMAQAVGMAGGSQPHSNFQPYLCVDFIISLFGIFPSQT